MLWLGLCSPEKLPVARVSNGILMTSFLVYTMKCRFLIRMKVAPPGGKRVHLHSLYPKLKPGTCQNVDNDTPRNNQNPHFECPHRMGL